MGFPRVEDHAGQGEIYHIMERELFCASRQIFTGNVRFGSKGNISVALTYVCFTSESGHELSALGCPLRANNGHFADPSRLQFRPQIHEMAS